MNEIVVTPEMVQALGKAWLHRAIAMAPVETILAERDPQEILARLAPEERLAGLDIEQIETYLRQRRQAEAKPATKKRRTRRKSEVRS